MLYRNKWFAGAVLVATLSFFATCNYIDHLRDRAIKAEDSASLAQAEIAGLNRALTAKPKEVLKVVEVPVEVVKLVKERALTPVVGAKVESPTTLVDLPPCLPVVRSDDSSVSKGTVLKADSLGVQTGFELFVGVAGQTPMWTGKVKTTLTAPNYRQEVSWTEEELKAQATVAFSQEIIDALKLAQNQPSWFRRHVKAACPGFGFQYGLMHQQFDYGPTCSVSFVWGQ